MLRQLPIALVLVLAAADVAQACACCDGSIQRRLLGWSDRGGALVRAEGIIGCSPFVYEEILRPGRNEPQACTDLLAGSEGTLIDCGSLSMDNGYPESLDGVPGSTRRRFFPHPVRVVPSAQVRAVLEPNLVGDNEDPDHYVNEHVPRYALVVSLFAGGTWHEIGRAHVWPGQEENHELYDGDDPSPLDLALGTIPNPVRVVVYPSPAGDRALIHFTGGDTSAGNGGEWSDTVRWGRLPPGVAMQDAQNAETTTATYAHVLEPARTFDGASPAKGQVLNAAGLRAHRAGEHGRAERLFISALAADHDSDAARYNLACALARLGRAERAIAELRTLREAGCASCLRRVRGARRDADFEALRSREDFQAVTAN